MPLSADIKDWSISSSKRITLRQYSLRRRTRAAGRSTRREASCSRACSICIFTPTSACWAKSAALTYPERCAGSDRDHQRLQAQIRPCRSGRTRRACARNRRDERHDVLPAVRRRRHDRRPARRAGPAARARKDADAIAASRSWPFRRKESSAIRARPSCMEEAIKEGCDIVGGLPWYEYTRRGGAPSISTSVSISPSGYDLDIHMLVDDTDDANSRSLEYLALKTMREDFHGRVAASHCGAMAGLQRRLRRQGDRHGGDRRHHPLGQRAHQPGVLGQASTASPNALAASRA